MASLSLFSSENNLLTDYHNLIDSRLELFSKIDNFFKSRVDDSGKISEENKDFLDHECFLLDGIRESLVRKENLLNESFRGIPTDEELEGIKGILIVYRSDLRKIEAKTKELSEFLENNLE